ncbi:MAG: hypothetical protein ACXVOH_08350 [Bacteroidia bacterium]
MKKAILSAGLLLSLTMVSCKKDRTCTCTISGNGFSVTATVVVQKTTKRAAEQGACASETETTTNSSGGTDVTTMNCTVN